MKEPDPYDLTRELLRHTGPLAATSRIYQGRKALTIQNKSGKIDLILDGGISPGGVASTVLDCTKAESLILRTGPVSWEEIIRAIAE